MGFYVKDKGGDFQRCPAGTHIAICYMVVDLGLQAGQFGPKEQVLLGWELPNELMDDGRPFAISNRYTQSLNEKATLRHHLEAWRGKAFTEQDLEGFDIRAILGKPCQVTVVHEERNGKTYANVKAVTAIPKGLNVPPPQNTPVAYSPDAPDPDAYAKLPEWIRKALDARLSHDDMPGEPAHSDHEAEDIPF